MPGRRAARKAATGGAKPEPVAPPIDPAKLRRWAQGKLAECPTPAAEVLIHEMLARFCSKGSKTV